MVYQLDANRQPTAVSVAPAGVPLLVEGQGTVTFTGSGAVSYYQPLFTDEVLPISTATSVRAAKAAPASRGSAFTLLGQKAQPDHRGITVVHGKKYYSKSTDSQS